MTRSWYQQQLIKLAAVARVDTEFALVLDADVVAVREFSDTDVVLDGRAIHHQEPVSAHPGWARDSAAALRMEPLDYCVSATPSILARDAVLELAEHSRAFVRPRKRVVELATMVPGLRRHLTTWRGRLLGALPWTEYQLYETFLVRTVTLDQYHCYREDPVMFSNSVWRPQDFDAWLPAPPSEGPMYFFSVVQESARIPVDAIETKLTDAGILRLPR